MNAQGYYNRPELSKFEKIVERRGTQSQWDWSQVDIKLGPEHVIYQKLANFMQKKDIHVNSHESAICGM